MSTIKYLTNLDLRGNKLLNAKLGLIGDSTVPFAFGVNNEGYLVVNDADGIQRRYATLTELETAIADALSLKLDKSGGTLTGAASYAEGVEITDNRQLVHKQYVDASVQAAVTAAAPQAGEFIQISAEREISLDRDALNEANGQSFVLTADDDGVISATNTVTAGTATRMKWVVTDSTGDEVEFKVTFGASNAVTVSGQGADPGESFTLSGQA